MDFLLPPARDLDVLQPFFVEARGKLRQASPELRLAKCAAASSGEQLFGACHMIGGFAG
jgi:hypothetical protein